MMNENLSRLTVQITKHQHKLLKYHAGPGTSISSLVRKALQAYFADAEEALREKYFEAAEYEQYEKYMAAQQAAGIEEPAIADASSNLIFCYTEYDPFIWSGRVIAHAKIGKMVEKVLPIFFVLL